MVKILLQHMPEEQILARCHEGGSALMYACMLGKTNLVRQVLKVAPSAQINAASKSGVTSLMIGADGGFIDVVEVLLSNKELNIFAKCKLGKSALEYARESEN